MKTVLALMFVSNWERHDSFLHWMLQRPQKDSMVSAAEIAVVRLKIFELSEREVRRWAPVISLQEQIKVDVPWREM